VEEGSLSRTLAFNCGHGYAQEDYSQCHEEEEGGGEKNRRHGRLHIGANGVSSPPEKWMKK